MAVVSNFQQLALRLINYWVDRGCVWSQPYDAPMGAGTFHPHTFLKGVGPEPWRSVYMQPCRRPVDGRYGESPYRFQHYYQLQVLLKPAPADIVDVFLRSLEDVGITLREHDIGLLEDDWKGPTLGAWGLGWEVRANGQEITQFTYFQQLGGMDVDVVCGEITYGLERLFMYATGLKNGLDIPYNDHFTYGDVYKQNEFEFSHFNFKQADISELLRLFGKCEEEVVRLCEGQLVLPAYDFVLMASHAFNTLDARGALSAGERQRYIGRVRESARLCAELYRSEREKLGFPMLGNMPSDPRRNTDGSLSPSVLDTGADLQQSASGSWPAGSDARSAALTQQGEPADLLIEFGIEEMPPGFQTALSESCAQWKDGIRSEILSAFGNDKELQALLSASSGPEFSVTERRFVLFWGNLPAQTSDTESEIWGPAERIAYKDGELSPAGLGFCRKNGLEPATVGLREKDGSRFLYARKKVEGQSLPLWVLGRAEDFLTKVPCPLKMRWLPVDLGQPFVRPVRWILGLHGGRVIRGHTSCFGLAVGNLTYGQRICSPEPIGVATPEAYFAAMNDRGIVLSRTERTQIVLEGSQGALAACSGQELRVEPDDGLLNKSVGLSETPYVFSGSFPREFLKLPPALIKSVLRDHMNYFSVSGLDVPVRPGNVGQGRALAPYFVGVAHYEPADVDGMRTAAEQVVIGRLADGAFYYDGDLAEDLEELRKRLSRQVFQSGLGSLLDKSDRLELLAGSLVSRLPAGVVDGAVLNASARFAKADLQTGCVAEFPDEMQGVMGGVLVRHQGSRSAPGAWHGLTAEQVEMTAAALSSHYAPTGATDSLPSSREGLALSLLDKWDTVSALMARGDRVKGNKDPFGLRRNTLAVLRLCGASAEAGATPLLLSLSDLLGLTRITVSSLGISVSEEFEADVVDFLLGRLSALWRESYLAAAAAAGVGFLRRSSRSRQESQLNLAQCTEFVRVLDAELRKEGSALGRVLASYHRCRNIIQKAEGFDAQDGSVDQAMLADPAEGLLFEHVLRLQGKIEKAISESEFAAYLSALAELEGPLQSFFEAVMVMSDDLNLRKNRLLILQSVLELFDRYADFSSV